MNYSFDVLVAAHRHSSKHRSELERSEKCACFFCGETFGIKAVEEWVDDSSTAICPQCGVDAVIGSAPAILFQMRVFSVQCTDIGLNKPLPLPY